MTTLEFQKFPSIENAYRKKYINSIMEHPVAEQEWCVMEKVHGANMSFAYIDGAVIPGKRTSFLLNDSEKHAFYKCQEVIDEVIPKVVDMKNHIESIYPEFKSFIVYGELFGGLYGNTHYKPIQKGVQYCEKMISMHLI